MNLKFIIILAYYNRPKIVRHALRSISNQIYRNFDVVMIDDGSSEESRADNMELISILQAQLLKDDISLKVQYINDTPYQKLAQGGSRHGEYMNKAILESSADIYVCLCDDDALLDDYLYNLNTWFNENLDKKYCYSHVRPFNPITEDPFIQKVEKCEWWTNHNEPLNPWHRVDSSQVVFRTSCFKEDGLRYPSPQTENLDAAIFSQAYAKYGLCHYTGFDGQYKGVFEGQMVNRSPVDQYFNSKLDKK
jgi:glycosyltransferase involved in cell wall biosynthesis